MEHNEAWKKITAFIDGELKEKEKTAVSAHMKQCVECSKEYETLSNNDLCLKKAKELQPSDYFRQGFYNKIETRVNKIPGFSFGKLIPVPIAMAILVLIISGMLVVTPMLYAANNNKNQAKEMAGRAFAACMAGSIFAPAAYAKFCDACGMNMCTCCSGKTGQKCIMGGHYNGK